MVRNQLPSQDRLKSLLRYDPLTGELRWAVRKGSATAGSLATRKASNCGHIGINIDCEPYLAHRVIWKLQTGADPADGIDHADGDHANNKWGNLREASHCQNMANRKRPNNNTSGIKGISFHIRSKKWQARISANGVSHHLGYFETLQTAAQALKSARSRLHGEFARAA